MIKTVSITIITLIAFAANSVLCRIALGGHLIDAAGFTIIRLASGSLILLILLAASGNLSLNSSPAFKRSRWLPASMLFCYAAGFSFAYVSLEVATGALILFGAVQLTMLSWSVYKGERLFFMHWAGIISATAGFVYLVMPGVKAPSFSGLIFMGIAGIAWGIYSLTGKKSRYPLPDTAGNFFFTLPAIIFLALIFFKDLKFTGAGLLFAFLSGGIASALGYYLWYNALKGLNAAQAAVVQLFVPVLAAAGGVIFLSETITLRLMISALLIIGGNAILLRTKFKQPGE